jgi:hypothetical protein
MHLKFLTPRETSYNAEMKVGGVVYMYPIYPGRITRNDCANIKEDPRRKRDVQGGPNHDMMGFLLLARNRMERQERKIFGRAFGKVAQTLHRAARWPASKVPCFCLGDH